MILNVTAVPRSFTSLPNAFSDLSDPSTNPICPRRVFRPILDVSILAFGSYVLWSMVLWEKRNGVNAVAIYVVGVGGTETPT